MRLTVAVLVAAAAVATASTPAAACGIFSCWNDALADDAYPPGNPTLDPGVREAVRARAGKGLSAAGFYNDPTLALARRESPRPAPGGFFDAPQPYQPAGFIAPAPDAGPDVVYTPSGWRRREAHPHSAADRRPGPHADVK
jgi:hypothetical protein